MGTKVAVTGTPGVGKTTVASLLADELGAEYFDVTEAVREGASSGYDEERGVPVADIDALRDAVPDGDVVIDGHIAHHLEPDAVVVLRCAPDVLRSRLEERGWDDDKIHENVESETLDVVLADALGTDAPVYEFDTTGATPDETVERVVRALEEGEERHGVVDWSEHIETGAAEEAEREVWN
ncbi:MAG: adenylate kinase family protein [Halobacteriales archaeon]|nr:adenylate kinase family protein [Halobacteriales archaeon]